MWSTFPATENINLSNFDIVSIDDVFAKQLNMDDSPTIVNLINLPDITISTNEAVVFASPINIAPWNIIGVGNPIRVNQNTANMVTGVTYYLTAFSTQLGRVTQNPDGTGTIDTTDLVGLPQPILAWVQSSTTVLKQTIINGTNVTLTNDTDVGFLTATDLTFNGVSTLSTIQTLQIKQTNTTPQNISAAIYADGRPPTAPTASIINTYAFTPSWYFKNTVAGYKINWYLAPNINMTVVDVLGLYMYYFNGITTSNDNTAFIVIYTQPQVGDLTFYHSRRVYIFDQTVTPVANTRYCMFTNLSGTCPTPAYYAQILNNMQLSPAQNVGLFEPSELILAFAIGSNSSSVVNSVEFCVSKFGIMTLNGTAEAAFFQN